MLRSLGYTFYTAAVKPRFPLIFHETFTIEGYFKDVHTANDLRAKLISEPIELSIYQNGHRLAFFRESLASLLTHQNCKNILDLELLMSTTKCFPGILSPKVETQIEFRVRKYNPLNDCVHATSRGDGRKLSVGVCWGDNSLVTKQPQQQQHGYNHAKLDEQEARLKRQKAVCHQTHIHINNENTANFIPVNIIPRKQSDSSNSTEVSSLGATAANTTTGGVHFSVA